MSTDPQNGARGAEGGAEPGGVGVAKPEKDLPTPDLPPNQLTDDQIRQVITGLKGPEKGLADAAFVGILEPNKRAFLVALSLCGRVTKSCQLAGIHFTTPYTRQWKEDSAFQDGVRIAKEIALQVAEDEAYRRAVEGTIEPTGWYKGEPGGYVRRFSDVLMIFWLKGANPDKYKDRMEIRGTFGHIDLNRVAQMPNGQELLSRLAAGESPFSVLGESARLALPAGKPEVGTLPEPSE